ncbi:MAG: YcjF family protein [Pseudopelagicola sp.]|nr:YcjF family protein [Pseudopelagicola sp.]
MTNGPVLIDLENDDKTPSVQEAAPVPDLAIPAPEGQAMLMASRLAARPASRLARWFWGLLGLLLGTVVSVAAWDFLNGLLARTPILGWVVTGLVGLFLIVVFAIALRELAGFARLRRVDSLRTSAELALASDDPKAARDVVATLDRFYRGRADTEWGRARLAERKDEIMDGDALLGLAETELLAPLDKAATSEIESASRQVATITALVPMALVDVVTALGANIRMIRRIAEIYGGRAGTLGSWRLLRAVMTHLVATGAVAIGDDMLGSLAGGGVLSKLSRRFGEGLVNGALTARVGVAAMEVCRPMPFTKTRRPSVGGIVKRALTGLFGK